MALPFIFDTSKGETPESIAAKRKLAMALLGSDQAPRTVGEGLNALGDGIVANVLNRRADAGEKAGSTGADSVFNALFGGGSSPSPDNPSVPMTGAAKEVSATSPVSAPVFANDGTELGALLSDPSKRATLPAGMRNNNPGNIKFVGQKIPGIVGPSVNTDQGDPQAVFATPEAGMNAMFQLAKKKYDGGKRTTNDLIAGNMGWTPGNYDAAANVARSMGLRPTDDINLNDPQMAAKFLRGLIIQEHGKSGALYPEQMILSAIGGVAPTQVASAAPMMATDATTVPPAPQAAVQALTQGQAPQLPPPTNVASPPPVQVAQSAPQQSPVQALSGGPSMQQLIAASQNQFLSPGQRGVVNALLKQKLDEQSTQRELQLKQADPAYQMGLQKTQIELDRLKNPPPPAEVQALNARAQAAGLQPGTKAYQDFMASGGRGPLVTVNNGDNSSKFNEESDKAAATRLGAIVDQGNSAPQMMGDLQQLSELGKQIGTGKGAQITAAIGPYAQALGIDVKGLDETQAFQAIVNRIAPQMRPAGAGATSDFDARQFLSSLPSLGNQPGGNELISQTFQAIQQNKIAAAEIASRAQSGEIKWQDAEKQIRALPNPYEVFKANKDKLKAAETPKPQTFPGAPAVGTKEDGYVFKGGDPADPKNWQQEM